MAKISDISALTVKQAETLRDHDVKTTDALLGSANTVKRRSTLSGVTGIPEKRLLEAVHLADMTRIKGISCASAELLKASGVDTVKELRTRNPENLAEKMAEVNGRRKNPIVGRPPSAKTVTKWVDGAKALKLTVRT